MNPLDSIIFKIISFCSFSIQAHQQAWAWQDEWINLTIEDIRRLEREAQEKLRQKYHKSTVTISPDDGTGDPQSPANQDDPPPNYEDIENVNENHTELQLPSGNVFMAAAINQYYD